MTALSQPDIETALNELPGWGFDNDRIIKTFKFNHFREAMSFMVRVGFEAEAMGHHPEMFNVYNTVRIALNTHDEGGKVTDKDIELAKVIEHFNWTG